MIGVAQLTEQLRAVHSIRHRAGYVASLKKCQTGPAIPRVSPEWHVQGDRNTRPRLHPCRQMWQLFKFDQPMFVAHSWLFRLTRKIALDHDTLAPAHRVIVLPSGHCQDFSSAYSRIRQDEITRSILWARQPDQSHVQQPRAENVRVQQLGDVGGHRLAEQSLAEVNQLTRGIKDHHSMGK